PTRTQPTVRAARAPLVISSPRIQHVVIRLIGRFAPWLVPGLGECVSGRTPAPSCGALRVGRGRVMLRLVAAGCVY
ncbi:MAG: hypothetical protein ACPL7K_02890, partial [Armatimonadota bacterium]